MAEGGRDVGSEWQRAGRLWNLNTKLSDNRCPSANCSDDATINQASYRLSLILIEHLILVVFL